MATVLNHFRNKVAAVLATAALALPAVLLSSCGDAPKLKYSDTYNSGSIKVLVDESFAPLVEASLPPFHATYPKTQLNVSYAPEDSALRLLVLDSVQLVIATRQLNDQELEVLKQQGVKPLYIRVAVDGLAMVVNTANPDSLLLDTQVADIITGKAQDWSQVSAGNKSGQIETVFDKDNSANLSFLQRHFNLSSQQLASTRVKVAGSNTAVLEYVAQNKGAIGFVGTSWVYDSTKVQDWNPTIKVVAVGHKESAERIMSPSDYYQPYQAYLGDKSYPLRRDINWVFRGGRNGLANGYTNYMSSDKGQRIVLKHGLLPANTPVRLVKMNTDGMSQ